MYASAPPCLHHLSRFGIQCFGEMFTHARMAARVYVCMYACACANTTSGGVVVLYQLKGTRRSRLDATRVLSYVCMHVCVAHFSYGPPSPFIYACMCMCTCVCMRIRMCTCMYACVNAGVCVCLYDCMLLCMYGWMCTNRHTHTHTHTKQLLYCFAKRHHVTAKPFDTSVTTWALQKPVDFPSLSWHN
jgi:hypothetical protein